MKNFFFFFILFSICCYAFCDTESQWVNGELLVSLNNEITDTELEDFLLSYSQYSFKLKESLISSLKSFYSLSRCHDDLNDYKSK